jgi:hypothetical protein
MVLMMHWSIDSARVAALLGSPMTAAQAAEAFDIPLELLRGVGENATTSAAFEAALWLGRAEAHSLFESFFGQHIDPDRDDLGMARDTHGGLMSVADSMRLSPVEGEEPFTVEQLFSEIADHLGET